MAKVAIIGCGVMGIKIAGELSIHGHHVALHDSNIARLNEARDDIERDRCQLIKSGFPRTLIRKGTILYLDDLKLAVHNAEFVFECITENLVPKQEVIQTQHSRLLCIAEITEHCPSHSIIGSGTISLDLDLIAEHATHPERTLGTRFLYPVYCVPEVEITLNKYTSRETVHAVEAFFNGMEKVTFTRLGSEPVVLTDEEARERMEAHLAKVKSPEAIINEKSLQSTPSEPSSVTLATSGSSALSLAPLLFSTSKLHSTETATAPTSPFTRECAVCMEAERDTLLYPCRHLVTCATCSWSLIVRQESCPICRAEIKEIMHVFHS